LCAGVASGAGYHILLIREKAGDWCGGTDGNGLKSATILVAWIRLAYGVSRGIVEKCSRKVAGKIDKHTAGTDGADPGVVNDQQIELSDKLIHGPVHEFLNRALRPGDIDVRKELMKSLARSDHGKEAAGMIPGDAAQ